MVQAVGFDLDYTLCDQDVFAHSFFEAMAGELGARLGCAPAVAAGVCRGALDRLTLGHPALFDQILRELGGWDPALVTELVHRYHRHRPPLRPYPGVAALLDRLAGAGHPLFLVTDGHSPTQRYKVEALGLARRFQALVFTGDFRPEQQKPSCFPFLYACQRLGLPPSGCVYVGDNPLCDFRGPRQLGMRTLGVATGPFAALAVPPDQACHRRLANLADLEAQL